MEVSTTGIDVTSEFNTSQTDSTSSTVTVSTERTTSTVIAQTTAPQGMTFKLPFMNLNNSCNYI